LAYSARTKVIRVDPDAPDPDIIATAAALLRDGRLVAFPTETVYGLGANALDEAAIDRIYRAKQRPASDPVIAHIDTLSQLNLLAAELPASIHATLSAFWPGPLTVVVRRAANVPANIAAGLDTVAVRMPSHPVARALISAAGVPVAAPSANTFTRPSATTAAHVLEDLQGRVDLVLDGGPTTIGLESTVLDMTQSPPAVLRPGGVPLEALRALIPDVVSIPRYVQEDTPAASPGQMMRHYSPRAPVTLFSGAQEPVLAAMREVAQARQAAGQRVGVLAADEDISQFETAHIIALGSRDDLASVGHNLFAALRELDTQGVDMILVRDFGRDGLGAALWDRLLRAAEGRVIEV
jgi:L-threonylcarbamoyladenylate synthase